MDSQTEWIAVTAFERGGFGVASICVMIQYIRGDLRRYFELLFYKEVSAG